VAHKPDEYVPRDEFIVSAKIYGDIAQQVLGN
jgi:acetylornithine deacetylase